eukprot:TRINITY_DN961_c0_g1_i1.p2 TRINITY_DN961_c0_g1~~TRINITY_DN961_c0_g1_i1.p2  ORF type:complete len:142 (-),score=37.39 TRINITY_DN961_c0_g1_i1:132-557(-)
MATTTAAAVAGGRGGGGGGVEVAPDAFSLRPNHKKKFRPAQVRELIKRVLQQRLEAQQDYSVDNTAAVTKDIAEQLRESLKELQYDRYKFIVHVVIGEQRGEGLKMGCRCFWDSDTDNYAEEMYMNKALFCVASVFGIYHY